MSQRFHLAGQNAVVEHEPAVVFDDPRGFSRPVQVRVQDVRGFDPTFRARQGECGGWVSLSRNRFAAFVQGRLEPPGIEPEPSTRSFKGGILPQNGEQERIGQ